MKTIEYEFILPDGKRRYEIVDADSDQSVMSQVNMFMKMHGAYISRPLETELPLFQPRS